MAAHPHRAGSSYGGAPLTDQGISLSLSFLSIYLRIHHIYVIACVGYCRDGLSTRPVAGSEEIQLRIDPMDLDDEITGLHRQVRRLKHVAEEIGTEVKYQKDFLEQLVHNFLDNLCFSYFCIFTSV
ncbi:Bet protein [Spatholobus suberectus]|nr:Bet protein [Spatholobus suberectus]